MEPENEMAMFGVAWMMMERAVHVMGNDLGSLVENIFY